MGRRVHNTEIFTGVKLSCDISNGQFDQKISRSVSPRAASPTSRGRSSAPDQINVPNKANTSTDGVGEWPGLHSTGSRTSRVPSWAGFEDTSKCRRHLGRRAGRQGCAPSTCGRDFRKSDAQLPFEPVRKWKEKGRGGVVATPPNPNESSLSK